MELANTAASDPNPVISTSACEFTLVDFKQEQNWQNPFGSKTVILYKLPRKGCNAFIAVYNLQSMQLLRFDKLNVSSQLTINADKLQPGI